MRRPGGDAAPVDAAGHGHMEAIGMCEDVQTGAGPWAGLSNSLRCL